MYEDEDSVLPKAIRGFSNGFNHH